MSSREPEELRFELAAEAARIVVESGNRDFLAAKRKAAQRLGVPQRGPHPSNREIEAALLEHQRLFGGSNRDDYIAKMLDCALRAMEMFCPFHPRLVGPLLAGTADENSAVQLHLFADPPDVFTAELSTHRIPARATERRVRYANDRSERVPAYLYAEDDVAIEIAVFPLAGRREAPVSAIDGRPMKRAGPQAVRALRQAMETGELPSAD